ncbi:precorrin-6y C5,15-methyltransferase (decarboxylating) subunit CbiE [Rhodoblastus acidophilus]|uniref:Precorrin-6y C5,15-methyltransferase (Decarboxylating) subunit CbiE n=1 Tax=Candidatus Rhodoblastus alkanivorans TaxID=2954117 RepID=A0ABS9Z9H0_9HYPH|nr:precorrin-6y C5,15-methyltransferase (decarboxylating) subunit CbiE [Candidatus Rhodoblastus alkanivorans]MCI4679292.1 precorrin-6y C5,15-methyltransferase (decarboxylating) subunit CbiE [Candidatus Rhodoblastus alkanivorans]MCI4684081.1 precorrin-6y C5,15-methyltransferase (decarboxylating) subunit CbiE [Candidatus Rhodoblastus alkanivorans]MDI4641401.1 precorrin-6y C5,15-methyltransferase (decarboxylating) subunit CbiE [Rhodoblastus acidophilus]
MSPPFPRGPWLTLVGLGEDGRASLSPAANAALAQAALVVGGARHLALVAPLACETLAWPSPMDAAYPQILARRGEKIVVLASGDPFFYGVGSVLARFIPAEEMTCLPAPSAFSLVAARLGWAQQDCALITLHGRPLEKIIPHLVDGAKIIALSWDGATPQKLASLLTQLGFGASRLTICERLGGPHECMRAAVARDFALADVDALNTIALDLVADRDARIISRAPGLPDDFFEHDGQITKAEIRALTLSALKPRRGELLWDIGAGSGSVAIEFLLADANNSAIAIEAHAERAARIRRNALVLGAPQLKVIEGRAPEALRALPQPQKIFVGGGVTAPGMLDAALDALAPGGRLVVNGVTLETQALLIARHGALGGELISAQISRAEKLGGFFAFRPALPIVQWSFDKAW